MSLKKALFDKEKKVIITKNWGSDFNENPYDVINGIKKPDEISEKLNEMIIGLDISSFQKWRVEDTKGKIYYNTSGWQLVELVNEQRKDHPLMEQGQHMERLKWGTGPYNIFIPETICDVREI